MVQLYTILIIISAILIQIICIWKQITMCELFVFLYNNNNFQTDLFAP